MPVALIKVQAGHFSLDGKEYSRNELHHLMELINGEFGYMFLERADVDYLNSHLTPSTSEGYTVKYKLASWLSQ